MKYALITDMHFGARNDSLLFLDYYEKFYSETFFPTLEKEKIANIIILGDTFDRRKYVNYQTLQRSKQMFFDVCRDRNIFISMLVGNHDTYFKNTNEVNSINLLLNSYDNILVFDKPETIGNMCYIPWICADNYEASLNEINNTQAAYCFGHFEIDGFAMYRGLPSSEGLSRGLFRKFAYTFSGHYHHRSSADGIYYLGNPYELTWSDYNDPRGFHIFDTSSETLSFYSNPNVMFHRIVYDDTQETMVNPENPNFKNRYLKVVVVNKSNPYYFDRFIDALYSQGPADLKIVEDFSDITEGLDEDMIDQAEDTLTILNKYIDSIPTDNIDNNKLKGIFRELYLEALNTV